jgi:acyl-CoA reductase-like NAD-dependent aldehyde dehydrogenase
LGVVGVIGAWNFPLNMFVGKIAPVLAAGNCVLYKPAEPTPITTLEIAKLWEKILPPGVLNVVTGDGPTTGAAIVDHSGIRMISVTGASETGKLVMAGGARTLKRLALELGGKNGQIVFPDANLDRAAQGILLGAFMNQGQVCTAGSRIFAHRKIAAALREKIIGLIPKLKIGNPYDEKTEMGTLSSQEHLEKVLSYVTLGKDEGAQVATGGGLMKLEEFPRGLFMAPTILDKVEPGMRVAQEEIFGPVAAFFEWEDEAAMLEAANGVEQGLAAGIWTENLSRAHSTARAVEAGRVWVNCYNLFPSGASFGGMKASGYGREDAFETLFEFTEVKNVIMDTAPTFRKFYD